MHRLLLFACSLGFAFPAFGASEKSYVEAWAAANKGTANARLADGTRCDVSTPTHAIEVTFAPKWQEAVGRALYQATQLNKHAGIVLIFTSAKDEVYRQRLDSTIAIFNLPIDVWETGEGAQN